VGRIPSRKVLLFFLDGFALVGFALLEAANAGSNGEDAFPASQLVCGERSNDRRWCGASKRLMQPLISIRPTNERTKDYAEFLSTSPTVPKGLEV